MFIATAANFISILI